MTQEIIIENIHYLLNIDNKTAKVIDYQNDPIDVIIPESVKYKSKKYKVTTIKQYAFSYCHSLTSITIPNNVTKIGYGAFDKVGLTLPKRYTEDGKLIAYKGFNADMTCRDFQYKEGKTFEIEGEIKCCNRGFHACTSILDVFNYYNGEIGTDIVIHEVYLSGDIDEDNDFNSKVCSSKIEIGRRLTVKDINNIINNK
jgi:hypothetical protein